MLRLSSVSKRYGLGRWILAEVDMEIEAGESVAVTGANGSGKSTLLRMLAGVSRPTSGTLSGIPPLVGYVPERFPSADRLSAIEYLTHLGRVRGLRTAAASARAVELLDRLRLAGGVRTPIRALSKGNAQKVALAQALLIQPRLLILDEPWSGLDATAHDVLGAIIDEVTEAGGAVVFTDHRESTLRTHAGRTYEIEAGRVTERKRRAEEEPTAEVVLRRPDGGAGPRELDWYGLPGVTRVVPTARTVRVQVAGHACDALLLEALRNGWSVAELSRDAANHHAARTEPPPATDQEIAPTEVETGCSR